MKDFQVHKYNVFHVTAVLIIEHGKALNSPGKHEIATNRNLKIKKFVEKSEGE
jgi:hypothetical protein